jgi:ferredoxin-NADP reductase
MLIDPYQFQPTTIEAIIHEAKNAVSVKLATPPGYTFELGQHAVLRVTMPDGSRLVRQYSFSAPQATNELWFTVVKEPDGQVSGWFTDMAKVGDIIEISHPFTGPLVHKNTRGDICMIAGGSGIAPLIGFVRQYRSEGTPFTLLYSTRNDELCYKDELLPLPGEAILVRLTDKESRFTHEDITRSLAATTTVLLCGSRPFVLAMREHCERIVSPTQILSEAFSL